VVLAPTRELACQIHREVSRLRGCSSAVLHGGVPKGPQLQRLSRGVHCIVATPGRLNDLIHSGDIDLRQVSYLVLDEADRMLDMGFEPQIHKIVSQLPQRRQTLLFSATWPHEVRVIASRFLRSDPVHVFVGSMDTLMANKAITQHIEILPSADKKKRLVQVLRSFEKGSKIIIFCSTKKLCDQLAEGLSEFGATCIHGDKSQHIRDRTIASFRDGSAPVMCATDVAARGLDVPGVNCVVNYDFPNGGPPLPCNGLTTLTSFSPLKQLRTCLSPSHAVRAHPLTSVLLRARMRVVHVMRGVTRLPYRDTNPRRGCGI
jgi:ATP-dependent RNA helicase DDX5/DBP2